MGFLEFVSSFFSKRNCGYKIRVIKGVLIWVFSLDFRVKVVFISFFGGSRVSEGLVG